MCIPMTLLVNERLDSRVYPEGLNLNELKEGTIMKSSLLNLTQYILYD